MNAPHSVIALARAGEAGRDWYARAEEAIEQVGGPDADLLARLIAVLSPQASVEQNATWAVYALAAWRNNEGLYDQLPIGRFRPIRQRVSAVLAGGEPTGPKVYSFYRALTGDCNSVAIDSFVLLALGLPLKPSPHGKRYDVLADYLRACASVVGWPPREFQSALWHAAPRKRPGGDLAHALHHAEGLLLQHKLMPILGLWGTRKGSEGAI